MKKLEKYGTVPSQKISFKTQSE